VQKFRPHHEYTQPAFPAPATALLFCFLGEGAERQQQNTHRQFNVLHEWELALNQSVEQIIHVVWIQTNKINSLAIMVGHDIPQEETVQFLPLIKVQKLKNRRDTHKNKKV
jgi:hypothetical protein